ncbi:MAG: hypothetical protein ACYCSB_00800 [bacterium]
MKNRLILFLKNKAVNALAVAEVLPALNAAGMPIIETETRAIILPQIAYVFAYIVITIAIMVLFFVLKKIRAQVKKKFY